MQILAGPVRGTRCKPSGMDPLKFKMAIKDRLNGVELLLAELAAGNSVHPQSPALIAVRRDLVEVRSALAEFGPDGLGSCAGGESIRECGTHFRN